MKITFSRVTVAVIVSFVVIGAIWSFLPQPVSVEIATVRRGKFVATVDEYGRTRVNQIYTVSSPLTGLLARISLEAGDQVSAGEVVASITPSPASLLDQRSKQEAEERLGAAEAEQASASELVARARAQADQATSELERTRALVNNGVSPRQALERAELAKQVADRDLGIADSRDHAAAHILTQAKALLARYDQSGDGQSEQWNIKAPISGVILKVVQKSEAIVQPGTELLQIGNPKNLEVVVDVLSSDAAQIREGSPVTLEGWGGRELAGRVRRVEPSAFTKVSTLGVEEQRVNVIIDLLSPQGERVGLADGFRILASITVFTADDAVIVPAGALFRRDDKWNVFVVDGGRVRVRTVSVLRRSGQLAAISAGLAAGARVIVYPGESVVPGIQVKAE